MKSVLRWIVLGLVGYVAMCVLLTALSHVMNWTVGWKFIISTAIQLFAGVATFLAVVVSLFGHAIKRRYERPNILFNVRCDDEHCVLRRDENGTVSSSPRRTLEIYVSAKNTVEVEAVDAQLICNKAFVSQDGVRFTHAKTFRAASFRWLYSSEDKKFLTTLRHSVEKYAKVVELVDLEVENEITGKPNAVEDSRKHREVHFEICLSLNDGPSSNIEIGAENRAVLLSLCLASASTQPAHYYLKIYFKSGNLESMPTRERLEVSLLTLEQAQDAVAVKLD